ncbi:MAG: 3-deoxy-manno-octulosonate cytidylyltransferase [Alphaproteobacteria bacterium]|nr:3-deoxy-manno-octulosonate cytidylyltransferase [Alphaproteobacteria bacterium]
MTVAIFIPARLESKRLPKKLIQQIGEKPLIMHVVDRALESVSEKVVIATDSVEIMRLFSDNKDVECIMTSKEHQTGSDRIYEALTKIDPNKSIDYIMNLQGDLPFIKPKLINDLIKKMTESSADVVTLAYPIQHNEIGKAGNENVTKAAISFYDETNKFGRALYFSRQPIPHNASKYYEHIGIYLFKRSALEKFVNLPVSSLEKMEKLEQIRLLENNMSIDVFITDTPTTNVDTEKGLEKARKEQKEQKELAQ